MQQPHARIDIVEDTYFGTTIADPYRWMEDVESEEFQTWIKQQGIYTRTVLDALPERAALVERIRALRQASARIFDIKVAGGRVFYVRTDPDMEHARLIMRNLPAGPEQVLYDPNPHSDEVARPLAWYVPSPNGQRLLFNISVEEHTLHLLELDSGAVHDLGIARTGYDDGSGRGSPCWLPDSSGFVYIREGSMWLHRLGSNPEQDTVVWGTEVSNVPTDADGQAFVALSPTSDWMLGLLFHGDRHEFSVYTAPLTSLDGDPAAIPWFKVAGIADGVVGYALHGDMVYLRTHRNAPRYQIIATPLYQPWCGGLISGAR